jgi:hypothetical protein
MPLFIQAHSAAQPLGHFLKARGRSGDHPTASQHRGPAEAIGRPPVTKLRAPHPAGQQDGNGKQKGEGGRRDG